MSTIGKITLQSDENGFVTLQCDRCKSRFKVDCAFLNDELQGEICCPICGISNELNTYYPEEVIEGAEKIAIMEAEEMIKNAFKSLNSKYLKVKISPTNRVDTDLVFKNKDYDMQELVVHCCEKKMALSPVDMAAGFYCPYCGRIVK